MPSWFRRKAATELAVPSRGRKRVVSPWLRDHPGFLFNVSIFGWIALLILWLLIVPDGGKGPVGRVKAFAQDPIITLLLWGWSVLVGVVLWRVSIPLSPEEEEKRLLRKRQKERIQILEAFEPTPGMQCFHDDKSIFNAMIGTLSRVEKAVTRGGEGGEQFDVCLLLCSPALDYLRDEYRKMEVLEQKWGDEFVAYVEHLLSYKNVRFSICHLPLTSQSGINAMHDFLSVLANYLAATPDDFTRVLAVLKAKAEAIIGRQIPFWVDRHKALNRFHVYDHTINIPFQIVLVNSKSLKEVVVSYAGREILEKYRGVGGIPSRPEKLKHRGEGGHIKGFFSSDPYVVETFHHIFLDYVQPAGRAQFVPKHTRDIIAHHGRIMKREHVLSDYYFGLLPTLKVSPGSFSPEIANSTKFTTWVLERMLTTGCDGRQAPHWCGRILDIGAGTGVLGMVARAAVQRCTGQCPQLWAIENTDNGFANLKGNCDGLAGVELRNWTLDIKTDNAGGAATACFLDRAQNPVVDRGLGSFNLIIADLPFVSARDGDHDDGRFLDPGHSAHESFFKMIASSTILAPGGCIVTAFSSLGGPEDIGALERMIRTKGLQVIQRSDFFEHDYMWIVYVIMRKGDFEAKGKRFWWERLGVGKCNVCGDSPDC